MESIHIVDKILNKRFVVDEMEVVYKEPESTCDFVNHIVLRYSCCDNARCVDFTEEKFKFDGSNICDYDIYLEYVEVTEILFDGKSVYGDFSIDGLPLHNRVNDYRLIYCGDVSDK